jgi:glucosamine--fructose-6-phosphate aminotransferase (isomerizing)
MLFPGRQYYYPIALEAALKLKEISDIHAAGFPAGELKHGVIALVDPQTPTAMRSPLRGGTRTNHAIWAKSVTVE